MPVVSMRSVRHWRSRSSGVTAAGVRTSRTASTASVASVGSPCAPRLA